MKGKSMPRWEAVNEDPTKPWWTCIREGRTVGDVIWSESTQQWVAVRLQTGASLKKPTLKEVVSFVEES